MNSMNGSRLEVASKFAHLNPDDSLGEGISSGFSRIGMKGKVWSLNHQGEIYRFIRTDDGTPLPYLDVVFVGQNPATSRLYYPRGSYSEDTAGNAPTCASLLGVVPDPGVPIPQAKSCALCEHSQWLPNRGGKNCQEHRRTAVLLLPYMKTKPALEPPMIEPVFLKVPPASLAGFKAYGDMLKHRRAHWATCITRVTFDPTRQFQLNFQMLKLLTNAEADLVLDLLEAPQTQTLTGVPSATARIAQRPPADVPQETGLAAAFGANVTSLETEAAKPRTRTKKPVETAARPAAAPAPAPAEAAPAAAAPWVEEDTDLDASVAEAMSRKVVDILK
jgi:hypothetical protein